MNPAWVGLVFALLFGAIIGSFLNACIHRLPRDISLDRPRRSFCPQCQHPIRWFHNLPVVSFLWLRGRCADCRTPIPWRYPLVETLTALLFATLWQVHAWPLAPVYAVLTALLLAATFIDIDFLIIPDEISLGGVGAGLILATLVPASVGAVLWWQGLLWSGIGALTGYGLLWGVVELGKLAFGRKRHRLEKEETFQWTRQGDTATIQVGEEILPWEEIFSRASDELILQCPEVHGLEGVTGSQRLRLRFDRLILGDGREIPLDDLERFAGKVRELTIPREAMGFGDVKLLAAIGAFLGWQAVLFTVFAASILGSVGGVLALVLARGRPGGQIPFGPYLALGAILWMLGGAAWWAWYFARFQSF